MNKTTFITATIAAATLSLTSCGGGEKTEETAAPITYNLDANASVLKWKGDYADGSHSHDGTVKFSEATFVFEGEMFKSGEAKVDLKTIDSELDASSGEPQLVEHLNSDKFFNGMAHPTVLVTVKEIQDNNVTATFSIAGKKLDATIPANVKVTDKKATIKGKFDLDLTALDLPGLKLDPAMEAEAAKQGKKDQYVKPIIHFDMDLVMDASK